MIKFYIQRSYEQRWAIDKIKKNRRTGYYYSEERWKLVIDSAYSQLLYYRGKIQEIRNEERSLLESMPPSGLVKIPY
jgi:hypothetical protein